MNRILTSDEKETVRLHVFERAKERCEKCLRRVIFEAGFWTSMHLAHTKSRGAGGSWSPSNLKCLCLECHLKSHNCGGKPIKIRKIDARA